VLSGSKRGDGQVVMGSWRRGDADCVEIVPRNKLERIGVYFAHSCCRGCLLDLVASPAANGNDFPAFGAKCGNVDLDAESQADDADAAVR